jgi:signal peptidase I
VIEQVRQVTTAVLLVALLAVVGVVSVALVRGTWMVTPVLSGSMRPGLAVGGVVVSERVPVKSLAVRDVIIFRDPDNPSKQVVHRIVHLSVSSSGKVLINTQGDANTVRDPWTVTLRGDYAYRARWSVPLLGYVAVFFQNYRGFILELAGIVVLGVGLIYLLGSRQGRAVHRRGGIERESKQPSSIDRPASGGARAVEGSEARLGTSSSTRTTVRPKS